MGERQLAELYVIGAGASRVSLLVTGAARTKKNHGAVVVRKRNGKNFKYHIPSVQWTAWCISAQIHGLGSKQVSAIPRIRLPDQPYNCRALFYRDANRGDAVGYYQGLADLLERRGVLVNDRNITQWDGSRLLIDRVNPRVEVLLEALA